MSTSVFILCLVKCMAFVGWYVHRLKLGIFYIISNEAKVYKRRVSTMSTSVFILCVFSSMEPETENIKKRNVMANVPAIFQD